MPFHDFITFILDPQKIITAFGLIGVIIIVFAETGLFFGFFLPGDSLLFTAGFLASQGVFPLWLMLLGTFIAAVVGDTVGYWFGKKTGPALFKKEDSMFFKKKYIEKARAFYDLHGKKTIIFARFMPIVRTFAPIIAGIAEMNYRTFLAYNIVGGLCWTFILTLFGYFLGKTVPDADVYLLPIIVVVVLVSFIPALIHFLKNRFSKKPVV